MRIACPSCAAEYDVPDQALTAGPRLLRCARCGHQFQAALPAPAGPEPAAPEVVPAPELGPDAGWQPPPPPSAMPPPPSPGPMREPPVAPPLPRLGDAPASPIDRFALVGWLATIAVLLVAIVAVIAWRADIVAAWPPAARLLGGLS